MHKVLKEEIREGAPGGQPFEPLSIIARNMRGKRPGRKPLSKLAIGIRYYVASQDPYLVYVGFTGPKVSDSFKRLATVLQKGVRYDVTEGQRRYLSRRGETVKRGRNRKSAKVFFLRKSTTSLDVPARPIIDPFWEKHKAEARRNIEINWARKYRGERI